MLKIILLLFILTFSKLSFSQSIINTTSGEMYKEKNTAILLFFSYDQKQLGYTDNQSSFRLSFLPENGKNILVRISRKNEYPKFNEFVFTVEVSTQGQGSITSLTSSSKSLIDPSLASTAVPASLSNETTMTRLALGEMIKNVSNIVPTNTHSGSQSFLFLPVKECPQDSTLSLLHVVRTHHKTGGIAKKVFSYLFKKQATGALAISESQSISGSTLLNLCD